MFAGFCATFFVIFLLAAEKCNTAHNWSYAKQELWPDLCQKGQVQSPIDLNVAHSMFKNFSRFVFEGYAQTTTAVIRNNGHSAEIRMNEITPPRMHGGGLPNKIYELDHLHFHWESEHTINNHRYPLELHMVHYAKESKILGEALKTPHNVAVLGVFFEISPDDDDDFEPLVDIIRALKDSAVNQLKTLPNFNAKNFMPRDKAGFFRYDGSLTTPGCTEGIVWTVFTNTLRISKRQVKEFEHLKTGSGELMTYNYRDRQSTNGRTVYLRESPIGQFSQSGASSNQKVSSVFVTFFISLCISSYLFRLSEK